MLSSRSNRDVASRRAAKPSKTELLPCEIPGEALPPRPPTLKLNSARNGDGKSGYKGDLSNSGLIERSSAIRKTLSLIERKDVMKEWIFMRHKFLQLKDLITLYNIHKASAKKENIRECIYIYISRDGKLDSLIKGMKLTKPNRLAFSDLRSKLDTLHRCFPFAKLYQKKEEETREIKRYVHIDVYRTLFEIWIQTPKLICQLISRIRSRRKSKCRSTAVPFRLDKYNREAPA